MALVDRSMSGVFNNVFKLLYLLSREKTTVMTDVFKVRFIGFLQKETDQSSIILLTSFDCDWSTCDLL